MEKEKKRGEISLVLSLVQTGQQQTPTHLNIYIFTLQCFTLMMFTSPWMSCWECLRLHTYNLLATTLDSLWLQTQVDVWCATAEWSVCVFNVTVENLWHCKKKKTPTCNGQSHLGTSEANAIRFISRKLCTPGSLKQNWLIWHIGCDRFYSVRERKKTWMSAHLPAQGGLTGGHAH